MASREPRSGISVDAGARLHCGLMAMARLQYATLLPLQEAEAAERSQPPMIATCQACVKAVIGRGIEQEDRKRTWMADAEEAIRRGSVETARTIYQHALATFPGKKSIWRKAAQLEKSKGTRESLDAVLQKAVKFCPQVSCHAVSHHQTLICVLRCWLLDSCYICLQKPYASLMGSVADMLGC